MNEMMQRYDTQRGLEGRCKDKLPTTVILATIPVTINYDANGQITTQHEPTADDILAQYKPTFFPAVTGAFTPAEQVAQVQRAVPNIDELIYNMLTKNSRSLAPGNSYTWHLPVLQEKDCFGEKVGEPFICTRGEPTITPLYK